MDRRGRGRMVVDDLLQDTHCRSFPLYATFFYRYEILLVNKTKPVIFIKIFHVGKKVAYN